MNNKSENQHWGWVRTILGVGIVIGFFLPWLGGCSPENGLDLLLSSSITYHSKENYYHEVDVFPDSWDKAALIFLLIAGVTIFIIGLFNTIGLLGNTSFLSFWIGIISSYFSIALLVKLIVLKYKSTLYATITVGLPITIFCSITMVIIGLGDYFSFRRTISDPYE